MIVIYHCKLVDKTPFTFNENSNTKIIKKDNIDKRKLTYKGKGCLN